MNNQGTNFTEICRISNLSPTISGTLPASDLKNLVSSACVEDSVNFSSISRAQRRPNAHRHSPNFPQVWKEKNHPEVCVLSMTLSPKTKVRVSAFLMQCSRVWRKNWMQGRCSFRSSTTKSRISLNMHTNKHPSRSGLRLQNSPDILRRKRHYGS